MKVKIMMIQYAKMMTTLSLLTFCLTCLRASAAESNTEALPGELYHQAWQVIKDNYVDRAFNGQPWESWERRYSGKLKTEEDAYVAIETMAASLGHPENALVPTPPIQDSVEELRSARETSDIMYAKVSTKESLPNLGYIRIKAFKSQKCEKDLDRAIIDLHQCDGMIIDLRNNDGEMFRVAINCLLPFFNETPGNSVGREQLPSKNKGETRKVPITLCRFDNDSYHLQICPLSSVYFNKPVVVLINHETAASAVMFAAALKENGRATVVGTNSDKGPKLVETTFYLKDGTTLKIPTSHWFSPLSNDFSKTDFQPDVQLKLTALDKQSGKGAWWKALRGNPSFTDASTNRDLQLLKAEEILGCLIKN